MATIAQKRAVINARLDAEAVTLGENTELTGSQETQVTDAVAAELDDLNPNHQYPPTNK